MTNHEIQLPPYATDEQRAVVERLLAERPGTSIRYFGGNPPRGPLEVRIGTARALPDDSILVSIGVRGGTKITDSPEIRTAKKAKAREKARRARDRREREADEFDPWVRRGGRIVGLRFPR